MGPCYYYCHNVCLEMHYQQLLQMVQQESNFDLPLHSHHVLKVYLDMWEDFHLKVIFHLKMDSTKKVCDAHVVLCWFLYLVHNIEEHMVFYGT